MKKFALIVAGGKGNRMGGEIPKQFLEISGRPVLMHTLDVFFRYDSETEFVVVLPDEQIVAWEKLCEKYAFKLKHISCAGGNIRFDSVKNGLAQIQENGIVFIHDGVRPFVSNDTLERCFQLAKEKGNALPVFPVTESLRHVDNSGNRAVDRSEYVLVQTPQTFLVSEIKNAYKQPYNPLFTDDASVLEAAGKKINLVEGNRENIKITYPGDLEMGEIFLRKTKTI